MTGPRAIVIGKGLREVASVKLSFRVHGTGAFNPSFDPKLRSVVHVIGVALPEVAK